MKNEIGKINFEKYFLKFDVTKILEFRIWVQDELGAMVSESYVKMKICLEIQARVLKI